MAITGDFYEIAVEHVCGRNKQKISLNYHLILKDENFNVSFIYCFALDFFCALSIKACECTFRGMAQHNPELATTEIFCFLITVMILCFWTD